MKTDKILVKVTAIIAICLAGLLVFYFTIVKTAFDGSWGHTYFPGSIFFFCILGLIVFFFEKKQEWNNLSLDEKGKRIAEDLKSKKKLWFLNPVSPASRNYFALPILEKEAIKRASSKKSKNVTYHFSYTEKVRELVKEGRIENFEEIEAILKYC